jgi:hypothetical protein
MRRPGESYSQVILRLVELETSNLRVDQPSARAHAALVKLEAVLARAGRIRPPTS